VQRIDLTQDYDKWIDAAKEVAGRYGARTARLDHMILALLETDKATYDLLATEDIDADELATAIEHTLPEDRKDTPLSSQFITVSPELSLIKESYDEVKAGEKIFLGVNALEYFYVEHENRVEAGFEEVGATADKLSALVSNKDDRLDAIRDDALAPLPEDIDDVFEVAQQLAAAVGSKTIYPAHVLSAMLSSNTPMQEFLDERFDGAQTILESLKDITKPPEGQAKRHVASTIDVHAGEAVKSYMFRLREIAGEGQELDSATLLYAFYDVSRYDQENSRFSNTNFQIARLMSDVLGLNEMTLLEVLQENSPENPLLKMRTGMSSLSPEGVDFTPAGIKKSETQDYIKQQLTFMPFSLRSAVDEARKLTQQGLGHKTVTPIHVAYALLGQKNTIAYLESKGIDATEIRADLRSEIDRLPVNSSRNPQILLDLEVADLFTIIAEDLHSGLVCDAEGTVPALLQSLIHLDNPNQHKQGSKVSKAFAKHGIDVELLGPDVTYDTPADDTAPKQSDRTIGAEPTEIELMVERARSNGFNLLNEKVTEDAELLSALLPFSAYMNKGAYHGEYDPVIGRELEMERMDQVLGRRKKRNPKLVGERGVGKSVLVEGFVQRVMEGNVSDKNRNVHVFNLDLAEMVAGTKYRGQFEERIKSVIDAVISFNKYNETGKRAVLFIDELHTMNGAGDAEGGLDVSNILKPYLGTGALQMIGATTTDEDRKYFAKDKALARRFEDIKVPEPSLDECVEILRRMKVIFEKEHNVVIDDALIAELPKFAKRHLNYQTLPDSALDILEDACRVAATPNSGVDEDYFIDMPKVLKALEYKKGYAPLTNGENDKDRIRNLEARLNGAVLEQPDAARAAAKAIKRASVGMREENKTQGAFIAAGPTGVGKTLFAKKLAEYTGRVLIPFDMSEYQEKTSANKLTGADPGYVGYEEGGLLTNKVKENPYCVLLLDEIEKAHPDVFRLLLQVMEEGRLTDSFGTEVRFDDVVLIMTTNLGVEVLHNSNQLGFITGPEQRDMEDADVSQDFLTFIKKALAPEFVNRVDDTLVFKTLPKAVMPGIVDLELKLVDERMSDKKIDLIVEDEVRNYLAEEGYDPEYNARPLKRLIEKAVTDPIVDEMFEGTYDAGGTITVSFNESAAIDTDADNPNVMVADKLRFSFEPAAANDNVEEKTEVAPAAAKGARQYKP
jgi:ATP-dependent Clp protease ATP-binding subunit ClpA